MIFLAPSPFLKECTFSFSLVSICGFLFVYHPFPVLLPGGVHDFHSSDDLCTPPCAAIPPQGDCYQDFAFLLEMKKETIDREVRAVRLEINGSYILLVFWCFFPLGGSKRSLLGQGVCPVDCVWCCAGNRKSNSLCLQLISCMTRKRMMPCT